MSKEKKIRIAILISTYNGEKYIKKQLESVFEQKSDVDISIIIRDDGSTDGTVEVIKKTINNHNNVELIEGENVGLVRSFFMLLRYAYSQSYDYYSFCDQDDCWDSDKISVAVNTMMIQNYSGPLLYGACSRIVDEKLNYTGKNTQIKRKKISIYNTALQNICPGHNQVINHILARDIITREINFDNVYSQDLWITTVASIIGKIVFDNNPHTSYRMHDNNQLSYGRHMGEWIVRRIYRLKKKEGKKIARQLLEVYDRYCLKLKEDEKNNIYRVLYKSDYFLLRLVYVFKFPFYRQNKVESIFLRLIYLFGGYKIN